MTDFLKVEYEQCLSLLTYYEDRHHSFVKFASIMSSAVPSLILAIYQLGGSAAGYFWEFVTVISVITAVGLLSVFTVLVQYRLYFVYPARQVNSIRKHCLEKMGNDQFENQMYLNTSFSAFKWLSTHTLLNLFVSLQVGAFVGLSLFSYFFGRHSDEPSVLFPLVMGILATVTIFGLSAWYLYEQSKYHPDRSIHKEFN